ncbi:hypothetical protein BLNAU_10669 [Blattamonas nauphoetae]|uniref:Uncharacterized protein n=1 Tax=Blattamonas nauphoetae TaxID=2049346 RepID=A0ABQ9XPI9_9EUKA|nr:hypothetical protein BLNAU_10669 [Blattamonas nauphoetae]
MEQCCEMRRRRAMWEQRSEEERRGSGKIEKERRDESKELSEKETIEAESHSQPKSEGDHVKFDEED